MSINPFKFNLLPWRAYFSHSQYYGLALAIFLIGLIITFAAFSFYQIQDYNRAKAEFNRLADVRLVIIQESIEGTAEQLEYIKQFFYASEHITKQEFHIFILNSFHLYPNLLALGWKSIQEQAASTFEPAQPLRFMSLNSQPGASQTASLDFLEIAHPEPLSIDMDSYSTFQQSLTKARTSLSLVISDAVTFYQDGQHQGFLLFDPVFLNASAIPGSDQLKGVIIGFSDFNKILNKARNGIQEIGLTFNFYENRQGTKHFLYSSLSNVHSPSSPSDEWSAPASEWSRSLTFKIGDRIWTIEAVPSKAYSLSKKNWQHWEILLIGTSISALTGIYFLVLANRGLLIEQEVHERTQELATINRILQQEIHERQRIEEDFIQQQRYLHRRHEALEYLTKFTTSELKSAVHEVILKTASVLQIDRASIWFYEEEHQRRLLSCAGLYIFSTNSFSNHLEFDSSYFPHYFQALATQSHLIIPSVDDAELNQELASYLAAFHIISKLDIPIIFEGKLLGVLCCEETRGHREWLLEDRHFGQTIADIIAIMIEQSARRKAEKALQESEERLRFITQKAIDAIISITENKKIVSWNYGAEQMFGYLEAEILGKPLTLIIPEQDMKQVEAATKPVELIGKNKQEKFFPVEVSHTRWKSGTNYFDTVIIRDITERKVYEKKLIQAMKEAKAANEAKSEFLTTISHELRTPLNAIIGFDQCLLLGMDGPINEQQAESLKKIEKSSLHLLSLINDILDLAKIEANRMELEIAPQNIVEIATSCLDDIQTLAHQKNLTVNLQSDKPHILVEIDKMRIRQVLLNLIGNAVKFTEKGSISIHILNRPREVEIQIEDTGIGLSREEMTKLFKPFSQADSSITRKYGGTGLGLVISKKIIDLHRGTIKVQSQKGEGSLFTVIIPKTQ